MNRSRENPDAYQIERDRAEVSLVDEASKRADEYIKDNRINEAPHGMVWTAYRLAFLSGASYQRVRPL
jgi:hypothetical protein